MIYHVTISGRTFEIDLGADGVRVDGDPVKVDLTRLGGTPTRSLLIEDRSHRVSARRVGKEAWDLHMDGRRIRAEVVDERTRVIREMSGSGVASRGPRPIVAPMPGLVVKVEVEEGDKVRAGQGIVIVEAMKMENELKADADAVVERIHVRAGQAVDKDEVLVELGSLETEEGG
ncbi:MAG: biotin/lipoyl-binding protein [Gemmatimonadota bacterium]|nr:biotin/lipoyl-binding protein [Gemmatimonadota bacterium]